jgi:hypothetical protein
VTQDGGYRLELSDAAVDVDRFAALVAEARNQPPSGAAKLLRDALALWRGSPFGELGHEEPLRAAARELEDHRVAALEALFDAELAVGGHAQIVRELEALVAEEPLRERAREQLMLALYRCGRQADALRVYDDLRQRLSDELGIVPGERVRRLHEAIVRQDRALGDAAAATPDVARPSRQAARLLAGLVLVSVSVLVGVVLVSRDGRERALHSSAFARVPVTEERLAFIDLRHNRVLASLPIAHELAGGDSKLAEGRDADWLAMGDGSLLQVDRRRRRIANSTGLGFTPGGIAVGLGAVWVVAQDRPLLVRLEPRYGLVERRYRLPTEGVRRPDFFTGVAIAAGSVWLAQGEERVVRLDPRDGRTLASIRAPGATALAGTDDAVWLAGGNSGVLYRIDPVRNTVVTRVRLDPYLCCVAIGGGYVWALNYRVWKLSSDGRVVSSIPIDGDGANLAWSGDRMWVSEGVSGLQTQIDPRDDSTHKLRTGGLTLVIAVHNYVAMVVVGRAPPNLLAGIRGPVARILGPDVLQPDDPALASEYALPNRREQLLDATCARLLTLRGAPPPLGWRVAPEIADLPTSRDRREWMFRIRPGFRFSPPSNAPVTAASMRSTLERALSPSMGSTATAPALLRDLVGVSAFRAGRAPHISGLRASGDRLLLRLRAPAADLPLRMTARAFCAVPAGTPASASRFDTEPIPSAGPYYLAAHYGGNAALLRRNPNYHGPRRGRFAAFLYEYTPQLPASVDRVARGRADLAAGSGEQLRPRSSAARRFADAGRGRGPRWSRLALPATDLLRVRSRAGPLADRSLRRAVALALDRRAMAAQLDDLPTANVLPPRVSGWVPGPVPPSAPARARALLGRRQVTLVLAGCPTRTPCPGLTSLVRRLLRKAGFRVRVRASGQAADLTFDQEIMATPDPLAFVHAAGAAPAPSPRPSPAEAAYLARALDIQITRDGKVIPFGTPTTGQLASNRLGCRTELPLSFDADLAALCPRRTDR